MPLHDVTVQIDLRKPATLIGLGKPLIIAQKTGASSIKHYSDIDAVVVDFATNTDAYKEAAAVFAQENRPATLAIATYDTAAVDDSPKTAVEAFNTYYDEDWFFATSATDVSADQIAVADANELKKFKFFVARIADTAGRDAIKVKDYDFTIGIYHPADEPIAGALIGECGSQTVGSITWKFKQLKGITPTEVSSDELDAIHGDGLIAYVTKAGENQTSEGITVSGEYIDVMHGKSWIKNNIENRVQQAFVANGKIPFDNRGISLLSGEVKTVMEQGYKNGIIAQDDAKNPIYTVTAATRGETPVSDRAARVYNGLSFGFELAGAVHAANITGEIFN